MNKGVVTNGLALLCVIAGYGLQNDVIKTIGWFALSGAITNALAVHMLFEKVPGLYGSGVIPLHFEDVKAGIKNLIMEQFFSTNNIQRFLEDKEKALHFDLGPVLEKVDLSPSFDALLATVKGSSFGGMLAMFGGEAALEPMRQPFIEKMAQSLKDITQQPGFAEMLKSELDTPLLEGELHDKIAQMVQARLNELTPKLVKEIVQHMIATHLGWLVVWGGVFGGVIGALTSVITL